MSNVTSARSSILVRSKRLTLGFGLEALASLIIAFALVGSGHTGWAILVFIFAAVHLVRAAFGSFSAPCPACDQALREIGLEEYRRCYTCLTYLKVHDRRLYELEDGFIALLPTFAIPLLKERFLLPNICCVCGGPRSRVTSLLIPMAHKEKPTPFMQMIIDHGVQVPYCSKHEDGANLEIELDETCELARMLRTSKKNNVFFVLKVRSHRFYREFLQSNGMGYNDVLGTLNTLRTLASAERRLGF